MRARRYVARLVPDLSTTSAALDGTLPTYCQNPSPTRPSDGTQSPDRPPAPAISDTIVWRLGFLFPGDPESATARAAHGADVSRLPNTLKCPHRSTRGRTM